MQGTVKWFNNAKGFGFIDDGFDNDIFVHFTAIESPGYKTLKSGNIVEFQIVDGERGPQASHVSVIRKK